MYNKRIVFWLAGLLGILVAASACHKARVPIATLPASTPAPVPAPAPAPVPVLPPAPSPTEVALEEGHRAFEANAYDEASRAYNEYLQLLPSGGQRDTVLFRLGLMSATAEKPGPDWLRANDYWKRLVDEFPQSPLKTQVNLIMTLRSELNVATTDVQKRDERIRQLSSELDRLKKIDAERRKRP